MKTALLTALIVSCATQSQALSCIQPDVARSFTQAAQASERYIIMLGTFSFQADTRPGNRVLTDPEDIEVQSEFEGEYLTQNGFQVAPPLTVDLRFTCAGMWCGGMQSDGEPVLAFVEQSDTGYALTVGPCGGQAFLKPTPEQVDQVLSCMRGDSCEPAAFR